MKPSIGRIVHYVAFGTPGGEYPAGVCRAAIVTKTFGPIETRPGTVVGLCIVNPTGLFFHETVDEDQPTPFDASSDGPQGAPPKPGTWHWPERVE